MVENKRCFKCGVEVEDTSKFCSNCGYDLSEDNESEKFHYNSKKKSSFKGKGMIIGVLGVLCIAAMSISIILLPKIKRRIEIENKYKHAVSYLTDGKYSEAIIGFQELDTYKDSQMKMKEAYYKLADTEYENGNLKEAAENYYIVGDWEDAVEKYESTTYEYGEQLVSEWDYVNAAKEFEKIYYKDSRVLASFYAQFDTDRYHYDKFYYYAEEFEEKLNFLLQEINMNYTAKIQEEVSFVIDIYDKNQFTGTQINLVDYKAEEGTFESILIHSENVVESENDLGLLVCVCSISMADLSMTFQESIEYLEDIVDQAFDNFVYGIATYENTKNDIRYNFSHFVDSDSFMFSIGAPTD